MSHNVCAELQKYWVELLHKQFPVKTKVQGNYYFSLENLILNMKNYSIIIFTTIITNINQENINFIQYMHRTTLKFHDEKLTRRLIHTMMGIIQVTRRVKQDQLTTILIAFSI